METISALTNWRLTVRREESGVTILRAVTCDKRAVLPEEIFGLPVTALHNRALAFGAAPLEGEEVRTLGGAENEEWDNRNITELTLPQSLREIGDYCFMNLRSMETLRFYDGLQTTGSASFMNCRSFMRVELTRLGAEQGPALASIVRSLQQELDVTIRRPDGDTLRLLFPEYVESFTENRPAHYFQLWISGKAYTYHNIFRDKALFVSDYDALWQDYLAAEHDEDSALRLAYCRLRYPAELSDGARAQYTAYLRERIGSALSFAMREKDMRGFKMLLDLGTPDAQTLETALNEARDLRLTEATAMLLERRRGAPGAGRMRKFEL